MRTIDTTLISIHALRKESDQREWFDKLDGVISIHALRKESDDSQRGFAGISEAFQSTLSVRRATATSIALGEPLAFQSTLSVRRATSCPTVFSASCQISIHALRKESDRVLFQLPPLVDISIHALRKESDRMLAVISFADCDFNPRSP